MNIHQLKNIERSSFYNLELNDDMKEIVIKEHFNNLEKLVKSEIKKSGIVIFVFKIHK